MNTRRIVRFIKKQKICFIGSVDNDNYPNIKVMLKPRKVNGIKEVYFSTNTSSKEVKQYLENSYACIYFYHKGITKYIGVMLIGNMEVITDQKVKNKMWMKGDRIFYKKGVKDPDYCVLKFTAKSGRYYYDLKAEDFSIK